MFLHLLDLYAFECKQLMPARTECRAAKGECDLAEYCDGIDPLCPSDVYRRNTDKCTVIGVCQHILFIYFKGKRGLF